MVLWSEDKCRLDRYRTYGNSGSQQGLAGGLASCSDKMRF